MSHRASATSLIVVSSVSAAHSDGQSLRPARNKAVTRSPIRLITDGTAEDATVRLLLVIEIGVLCSKHQVRAQTVC